VFDIVTCQPLRTESVEIERVGLEALRRKKAEEVIEDSEQLSRVLLKCIDFNQE
jgi:hypothetical protein